MFDLQLNDSPAGSGAEIDRISKTLLQAEAICDPGQVAGRCWRPCAERVLCDARRSAAFSASTSRNAARRGVVVGARFPPARFDAPVQCAPAAAGSVSWSPTRLGHGRVQPVSCALGAIGARAAGSALFAGRVLPAGLGRAESAANHGVMDRCGSGGVPLLTCCSRRPVANSA